MLMIYISHKKGVVNVEKNGFFHQNNAAILNAPITKKYLLEQKIRFINHPVSAPDLNPM